MREYEITRLSNRPTSRPRWDYGTFPTFREAVAEANKLGYEEHRVQIRRVVDKSGMRFEIEPYEADCGCSQVIQFKG